MGRHKENHIGEPCSKCGAIRTGWLYLPGRTVCRPCKYAKDRATGRPYRGPDYVPKRRRRTNKGKISQRLARARKLKAAMHGGDIKDFL